MRFFLLVCALFTGCLFVPFIQAANDVGVTSGSRRVKLGETVKKYEEAVYWGNIGDALALVAPEKRDDMQRHFSALGRRAQVVSTNVVSTSFDDETNRGRVVVATKRYAKSSLVVTESFEEQLWVFSLGEGWQLHDTHSMTEEEAVGS
jgi:hypothetical protein